MEVGLRPGDFVLNGDPAPSPKKGRSPGIFGPHVLWPNYWMDQDATWYGGRPLHTRRCVSSPSPKRANSPFSANIRCGQTAGWTKMPLGMEVGLGPGDFAFDGVSATPGEMAHHPHPTFGPCLLWPNCWMDELKTPLCTEVDLVQGHIVLDGIQARRERGTAVPIFSTRVHCGHGRPSQLLLCSVLTSDLRHWYIALGQTESFPAILVDFH